jgi:threonine synthase
VKYVSTRGRAPMLEFADVVLEGLARDGGLYVPERLPPLPDVSGAYADIASAVMQPFADGVDLAPIVAEAYATFDTPDVCPLVQLDDHMWLLELWHGPTLAFKDVALQVVGRLMDGELRERSERRAIVVATSGDTGSAAIAACVGRTNLDIVVLHPAGRVSDVQRKQMTSVDEPNVHNVAVEGNFDDCQDLVKAMFGDERFRDELALGAMNSINWGRVVAQIVYFVTAARAVPSACVAVPTGNFGNILAGWYARRMGAEIASLIIGSNRNDILTRWVSSGALVTEEVVPTLSPSMDIQVSSNHERLLFELLDRDGERTADVMNRFRALGSVEVPRDPTFRAASLDDDETVAVIADTYERYGRLVDPHTAVAVGAASRLVDDGVDVVCHATAHPAKFPDAVVRATGVSPDVPDRLAAVLDAQEHYTVLPNDLHTVQTFVRNAVTN